mmetsp:Transcript_21808/g.44075  ORF Transcript_21808/g.44075 Transcript_21808/m.44075 type:complete len:155 (-) Transcript_21808:84-548(-)
MWIRSTPKTLELARRSENRSFAGWEQEIFNEELNFNADLQEVRCCHAMCLKRLTATSAVAGSLPGKDGRGMAIRTKVEGEKRCSEDQPFAMKPPRGSREHWVKRWTGYNESLRSKHSSSRGYGRCNKGDNQCVFVASDGTTYPMPVNCSVAHSE